MNQVAGLGFSNETSRFKKWNIPKVWSQVAGPGSPFFIYPFFNQVAGLVNIKTAFSNFSI